MTAGGSLPTDIRFLIGLTAPGNVADDVTRNRSALAAGGGFPAPLPAMVPLLELTRRPGPPVTGRLPVCPVPIRVSGFVINADPAGWWMLPVQAGGWFEELAEELAEGGEDSVPADETIFPLRRGIPLGTGERKEDVGKAEPDLTTSEVNNNLPWRALNLVCWEIHTGGLRPLHRAVAWRELWRRRLKRAPKITNNDNDSNLA